MNSRERLQAAWPLFPLCLTALLHIGPNSAKAAGGAFAVDDAEVGAPGECKVEAWGSFSDDRDFIGAIAPACVVDLGRPVDVSATVARARLDRTWNTDLVLKGKSPLIPLDGRPFGAALVGGVVFDLTGSETAEAFVSLPFTFQVAEPLRLNLNVGVTFDLIEQRNLLSWGAGFQYALSEPVTFVAEVFGFDKETGAQAGLRYTPHEKIDFDLIYGRNLTGERADWISLGVNLRF